MLLKVSSQVNASKFNAYLSKITSNIIISYYQYVIMQTFNTLMKNYRNV